jgi:hypothetical protein
MHEHHQTRTVAALPWIIENGLHTFSSFQTWASSLPSDARPASGNKALIASQLGMKIAAP